MHRETYIRKSLGMTAHWVTGIRKTEEGLEAMVERLGRRHLRCEECWMEINGTRGRVPRVRRWRDLSMRDTPSWRLMK